MDLKNKSVLITGASSGIGWETALAFAQANAKVAVTARRIDKLKKLTAKIEKTGAEALAKPREAGSKGSGKPSADIGPIPGVWDGSIPGWASPPTPESVAGQRR